MGDEPEHGSPEYDDADDPTFHLPASRSEEQPYEVGYKRPPRHSRFKPGQSGNPVGRKKGSRGLKTDLHTELNRVLEVKMGSYRFKGTSQQLTLRALALLAANGNIRATAQFLPLILNVFGTEDRGGHKLTLSRHDQEILDNFLAAFGGDAGKSSDGTDSIDMAVDAGGEGGRSEVTNPPLPIDATGDGPGDNLR